MAVASVGSIVASPDCRDLWVCFVSNCCFEGYPRLQQSTGRALGHRPMSTPSASCLTVFASESLVQQCAAEIWISRPCGSVQRFSSLIAVVRPSASTIQSGFWSPVGPGPPVYAREECLGVSIRNRRYRLAVHKIAVTLPVLSRDFQPRVNAVAKTAPVCRLESFRGRRSSRLRSEGRPSFGHWSYTASVHSPHDVTQSVRTPHRSPSLAD